MKVLFWCAFYLILSMIMISCSNNNLKIGFVADLSGRNSGIGVSARNGITMAIDEINVHGGINGRELVLISKDHRSDSIECHKVVNELMREDVDVIIGPLLSSMAPAVIDATKGKNILVISPTVSSDMLSGLNDNFFRVISPASEQGKLLAKVLKNKEITIVQNSLNTLYGNAVSEKIEETLPGNQFKKVYFKDKSEFPEVVEMLEQHKPESIVFICSGIDAAGIIQQYKKRNAYLPELYGSSWVKQSDILSYGGKTVEGMIVVDSYSSPVKSKEEESFYNYYNKRFGYDPNLSAIYSYESLKMYETGAKLSKSFQYFDVKTALISQKNFNGVADGFEIDSNGDAKRNLSLFKITNNQFVLFLNGSDL